MIDRTNILADFPAWTIYAAPNGRESLPNLYVHDDEIAVRINGQYRPCSVGTVAGYAEEYNEDPQAAVARATERGHDLFWVSPQAGCLTSRPQAKREFAGHHFGDIILVGDSVHAPRAFILTPARNGNVRLVETDPTEYPWGPRYLAEQEAETRPTEELEAAAEILDRVEANGVDTGLGDAWSDLRDVLDALAAGPTVLGYTTGWSRGRKCDGRYRIVMTRADDGEGAPLIRVDQEILGVSDYQGPEHPWYPTGGSWYLDTLLENHGVSPDHDGLDGLSLDAGQEWDVRGGVQDALRLARDICRAAGVEIDWMTY